MNQTLDIRGYLIEARYDGTTLTVHGTNKASRIALAGADHAHDVVIPHEQITNVRFKNANPLVNGNLRVTTTEGRTYQLHFRRKQRDDFEKLARALGWTD